MPLQPSVSSSSDAEGRARRRRRLLLGAAAVAAVSAVVAAVVIVGGDSSPTPPPEPRAPLRALADDQGGALVVGAPEAATQVVVTEDFGSPDSRSFEIASRDFLRVAADQGDVAVEYRPVAGAGGYSRDALGAWLVVLEQGSARSALDFHDLLFDRQPRPGAASPQLVALAREAGVEDGDVLDSMASAEAPAGVAGTGELPAVLVDGVQLDAASPTALADELQRMVLAR